MYFLETACAIQVRAQSGGVPLRPIDRAIVADGGRQFDAVTHGAGAGLAWPALLRGLDRTDPAYRH
jgi:hypothetical protein